MAERADGVSDPAFDRLLERFVGGEVIVQTAVCEEHGSDWEVGFAMGEDDLSRERVNELVNAARQQGLTLTRHPVMFGDGQGGSKVQIHAIQASAPEPVPR